MFIFGHLGIGAQLTTRWRQGLPLTAFYAGAVLPDLIDKPLYYGLHFATGLRGAELGLISGTRTLGHTALLAAGLSAVAYFLKSASWAALALGDASHLLLDHVWDSIYRPTLDSRARVQGLLWPLLGNHFPDYPFKTVGDHLSRFTVSPALAAEGMGLLLLVLQLRSYRRPFGPLKPPASRRSRRRG